MFSKVFIATALLAAATSVFAQTCDTGTAQCCDTVEKASDPAAAGILAALGIVLQDVDVPVGLTCSPITVIGVGGESWYVLLNRRIGCYCLMSTGVNSSANTVCCQDNSHGETRRDP